MKLLRCAVICCTCVLVLYDHFCSAGWYSAGSLCCFSKDRRTCYFRNRCSSRETRAQNCTIISLRFEEVFSARKMKYWSKEVSCKAQKSTSVVLMCRTWQILNSSCYSQWQSSRGIKGFGFASTEISSSINKLYNNLSENASGAES